ncbi:unnamed protein product [Thlaspi arvense]|uniref:PUM-HD domain-containing protein n=1 Tax=Thlaspi arvense TaxID=13288 RepID=A0AAU9SP82_THLAR|nr:unnamed protein product [Thlaspi arvense]
MANSGDPFSMLMSTLRAFHSLRFAAARDSIEQENQAVPPPPPPPPPRETPIANPPPRSTAPRRETNLDEENLQSLTNSFRSASAALNPRERETCLQSLFNLMNRNEEEEDDAAPFQQLISGLSGRDLQRMASLLTSDSDDYFFGIASNKNGSKRLQKLLGRSGYADDLFAAAILRRFYDFMTDKQAYYVAVQGMRVFSREKKTKMWRLIHLHAIQLACDRHGCVALDAIMTNVEDVDGRSHLMGMVAANALLLSYDDYGNFVVQHVLKLDDLDCTWNIAVRLRGNCVELSFRKYGSYIVEKLLETEESTPLVVAELLGCEGLRLMRLARSEFGGFVVVKALTTLTRGDHQFWGLVNKLMPFLDLLRRSPGRTTVATFLESLHH